MMKALPVTVLTALFPFVLMIMSGMGSVGAQSQLRHAKNTVTNMRMSLIFVFSYHITPTCHVGLEATYVEQNVKSENPMSEISICCDIEQDAIT